MFHSPQPTVRQEEAWKLAAAAAAAIVAKLGISTQILS
jgi:hypothetical protein